MVFSQAAYNLVPEVRLSTGFDHFDGCGKENFAAALILLCIQEDATFRAVVTKFVRDRAALSGTGMLLEWGREKTLDPDQEVRRRSDIWLRFPEGTLLLEVKTHSGWDPFEVERQLTDQRKLTINQEPVRQVILLAPGRLLRNLSHSRFPQISWWEFIEIAREIDSPTQAVQLAFQHWSENVERDFGLSNKTPALPILDLATQTGCLVAFLKAAILRLGGTTRGDTVWFSSPDGNPSTEGKWAWHSFGIPGQLPGIGPVFCGLSTYTAGPPGELIGTFLELYPDGKKVPLACVEFHPGNYSSTSLNPILDTFAANYSASQETEKRRP